MTKSRFIPLSITALSVVLFLLSFTLSGNARTLYSCQNAGSEEALLHTIDPATGATLTSTDITLEGTELIGCNGMA